MARDESVANDKVPKQSNPPTVVQAFSPLVGVYGDSAQDGQERKAGL